MNQQPENKAETVEEAAERKSKQQAPFKNSREREAWKDGFEVGANWKESQMREFAEWISVDSQLPEHDLVVLVFSPVRVDGKIVDPGIGGRTLAYYDHNLQKWYKGVKPAIDEPTHWMPLPATPKIKKNESR